MATSIKSLAGTRGGVNKSGVGRSKPHDPNRTGFDRGSAPADVNLVGANAGPGGNPAAKALKTDQPGTRTVAHSNRGSRTANIANS